MDKSPRIKAKEVAPCPPLGTINVIFVTQGRETSPSSRIITISPQLEAGEEDRESKRIKAE